jgi:hypothetical protein
MGHKRLIFCILFCYEETFRNGSDNAKTIYIWLYSHSKYISANVILYFLIKLRIFSVEKKQWPSIHHLSGS